jgi:hypothetical protein
MPFREVQYFRQPWLVGFVLLVAAFNMAALVWQVLLGHRLGTNPAPDWMIVLMFFLFGLVFPWTMLSARLVTEVRPNGLAYRFFPFHRDFILLPWNAVRGQSAVTYHPIREYGGWGIRYGKNGRAYNVSGDSGVLFTLADNRTLLIGSRRAGELSAAVLAVSGIGPAVTQGQTG